MKYTLLGMLAFVALQSGCEKASAPQERVDVETEAALPPPKQQASFVILYAHEAPESIREAALELQLCLKRATGHDIPIYEGAMPEESPFISIGATTPAEKAGLHSGDLPDEGYRVVSRDGNLYILGVDTPDGGSTSHGGHSAGSANGVYAFLERAMGVVWVMPGENGRVVPQQQLPELTETAPFSDSPRFFMRELSHLSDFASPEQRAEIQLWMRRNRLGSSVAIRNRQNTADDHWQHNWHWITGNPHYFETHPEWFAMNRQGKRWHPGNHYAKLETTNTELIRFFADKAIDTLRSTPTPRYFSLTPADAPSRWSESEESRAWYDPPVGSGTETTEFKPGAPSKTSLVLKWYYDVATLVEKEYPEGRLSGFIYSDYSHPPVKFQEKLPANLSLVLCGPNYGYELYSPEARSRLRHLLHAWGEQAPDRLYYYDIPSLLLRQEDSDSHLNFSGTTGVITPPGRENLAFLFENLRESGVKGAYLYGAASWSSAAMTNWIIARLLWDPSLEVDTLQREWLTAAYGTAAADAMGRFYEKLDALFRNYGYIGYCLTADMLKQIYASHAGELEQLFLEASNISMSSPQKARLDLLRKNLTVLDWRLRNCGFSAQKESTFRRSDDEVYPLLTEQQDAFPLFPGILPPASSFRPETATAFGHVQRTAEFPKNQNAPPLHPNTWAVLYKPVGGPIEFTPEEVEHGAYVASYLIKDDSGAVVANGIMRPGVPVSFESEPERCYFLFMPPRNRRSPFPTRCKLRFNEAVMAEATLQEGKLLLRDRGDHALYLYTDKATSPIIGDGSKSVVIIK